MRGGERTNEYLNRSIIDRMSAKRKTRIPVQTETRELVKAQKRGGQTYDELLRAMVDQYDPNETAVYTSEGND